MVGGCGGLAEEMEAYSYFNVRLAASKNGLVTVTFLDR